MSEPEPLDIPILGCIEAKAEDGGILANSGLLTLSQLANLKAVDVWRKTSPPKRGRRITRGNLFLRICGMMVDKGLCFYDSNPEDFTLTTAQKWVERYQCNYLGLERILAQLVANEITTPLVLKGLRLHEIALLKGVDTDHNCYLLRILLQEVL